MIISTPRNAVGEWSHSLDGQVLHLAHTGQSMQPPKGSQSTSTELSDLEARLFEWIRQSDFETVAWSTAKAAKAFKVKQDEIYEAVAALTKKVPKQIQVYYKDGHLHIAAE